MSDVEHADADLQFLQARFVAVRDALIWLWEHPDDFPPLSVKQAYELAVRAAKPSRGGNGRL